MDKRLRNVVLLPLLCLLTAAGGCATGKTISLPDGPSRPAAVEAAKPEGSPRVAVIDFTYAAHPSNEIGRDFDSVRSIVWDGSPGKAMADLVAAILAEKGVPAARAATLSEAPAGVPAKIWGQVTDFRVDAKRAGLGAVVQIEASVAMKLEGTAPDVAPGWNTTVSSSFRYPEPLFIVSGDLLHALNQAANDVAEESVRQLAKAGLVTFPAAEKKNGEPKPAEPQPEVQTGPEPKVIEEKIGDGGNK